MNQSRAKQLLPIITAFAEGKTIQVLDCTMQWTTTTSPCFDQTSEYRIKPEPKLRPWRRSDMIPLVGKAIILGDNGCGLITGCDDHGIYYYSGETNNRGYEYFLKHLKYTMDGGETWLPCGVMEDGQ